MLVPLPAVAMSNGHCKPDWRSPNLVVLTVRMQRDKASVCMHLYFCSLLGLCFDTLSSKEYPCFASSAFMHDSRCIRFFF